jgi:hypothetical protein
VVVDPYTTLGVSNTSTIAVKVEWRIFWEAIVGEAREKKEN